MKVNALKTIIKEAVKEAITELKEEQLQESNSYPEGNSTSRSSWEKEFGNSIRTTSPTFNKNSNQSLTLEQAIQQTKENLTPEVVNQFFNPNSTAINEDLSFTSANARGFIPSQSQPGIPTPSNTSKLEQDIMKKSAAVFSHLKKTGSLTK